MKKKPVYDKQACQVVIPPNCIGTAVIESCIKTNPDLRPTAKDIVDLFTRFISTYTTLVAKKITAPLENVKMPVDQNLSYWYNYLLTFEKETFDSLLSECLPQSEGTSFG